MTILNSVNYTKENTENVKTPYFLIHGKEDNFCNYKGIEEYNQHTRISDKTSILIDGMIK